MSPEQIQGQPIDRRSDIFSAGVLFYQLLTGQKPFEGTQWALAKKIVQDDRVWPSALVQIPAVFDQVVSRALAKAPEQRYPNARSFAEALRRIAAGKPLDAADQAMVRASSIGSEAEAEFWAGVKDSDDAEEVELTSSSFRRARSSSWRARKSPRCAARRTRATRILSQDCATGAGQVPAGVASDDLR